MELLRRVPQYNHLDHVKGLGKGRSIGPLVLPAAYVAGGDGRVLRVILAPRTPRR
jgi:hypothetical protein